MRAGLACCWFLIALTACRDRPVAPYPISAPPVAADSALGIGDVFEVKVTGEPDLSGTYQVAQDGTINFPLIRRIDVSGKTPSEVEADIQARLADGYLKQPYVSVRVTQYNSKKITVFGQVRTPGTFPYVENMSIVEAITRAGGFTPLAKKNSVRVTRQTDGKTERIFVAVEDIGQGKAPNFYLRPGDVVFVDERVF